MSTSSLTKSLCILVALILLPGAAQAQLRVSLAFKNDTYMLYEPVRAEVTVKNVSGTSFVLGGPGGQSWLSFNLTNGDGSNVAPFNSGRINAESRVMKPGEELIQPVILNRGFSLSRRGNYVAKAQVYFPPLQRYLSTPVKRFNVDDGRVFWERTFKVPDSKGGGFRKYQLLSYSQYDKSRIYLRLREEGIDRVLTTYALGRAIIHKQPQVTTDANNHLHVLYMGAPKMYVHAEIDINGKVLDRSVYKDPKDNPPRLVQSNTNDVRVTGGVWRDPDAPAPEPGGSNVRPLSERPPGWGG